ncbi:hypothetical protein WH5701_12273 [Synechococcus sp. WH 5701]|nr:hypothetical protein WH5701_12273 [Synechococcus sp. WH 5701]
MVDDGILSNGERAAVNFQRSNNTTVNQNARYAGSVAGGILLQRGTNFFLATNTPNLDGQVIGTPSFASTPVCILAGTLLATPSGDRAIESLKPGDQIITADGVMAVRFISRTCHTPESLEEIDSMPILIKQDALGNGLPCRDLYVSPDHAVLVDGHLLHASVLVNGHSIVQTTNKDWRDRDLLTYLNVELEVHAVIKAEGLDVESYIDNRPRSDWDNYVAYLSLYGKDEQPIQELPLPRIKFKRQMPTSIQAKLAAAKPEAIAL